MQILLYQQGFPALWFEEYDFSPYYHSKNDILANYNMDYCREVAKAGAATLLKYMISPPDINDEINPEGYYVRQNHPNPFNATTVFRWQQTANSIVTIKIFDCIGREAANPLSGMFHTGCHAFEFDATNLAAGVYLYQLRVGNFKETKKMLLLRCGKLCARLFYVKPKTPGRGSLRFLQKPCGLLPLSQ